MVDDLESKFHSRSSPIPFPDRDSVQNPTADVIYDTCSVTSHPNTFQSDFSESSESDSEAQNMVICYPTYKLSSPDVSDLAPSEYDGFSDYDDEPGVNSPFPNDAIVLEFLLEEIRRMIPGGDQFEFDPTFLEELDSRLLLTPTDVFDELCWSEISQSLPPRVDSKLSPDVHLDFENESVDVGEELYKVRLLLDDGVATFLCSSCNVNRKQRRFCHWRKRCVVGRQVCQDMSTWSLTKAFIERYSPTPCDHGCRTIHSVK